MLLCLQWRVVTGFKARWNHISNYVLLNGCPITATTSSFFILSVCMRVCVCVLKALQRFANSRQQLQYQQCNAFKLELLSTHPNETTDHSGWLFSWNVLAETTCVPNMYKYIPTYNVNMISAKTWNLVISVKFPLCRGTFYSQLFQN